MGAAVFPFQHQTGSPPVASLSDEIRRDADSLTVLATFGPLATKRDEHRPDGSFEIAGYEKAALLSIRRFDVRGIAAALAQFEHNRRSFVVREGSRPRTDHRRCRCLLKPHREADVWVTPTTFRPAAWHCLALDLHGVLAPEGLDWGRLPELAVHNLIAHLTPEFTETTCCWQWAVSAKPKRRLQAWVRLPLKKQTAAEAGPLNGGETVEHDEALTNRDIICAPISAPIMGAAA